MRYLGYEVCLLACRIAGVPDRQCNAFHRAQTCQPEGDSRSGFLPAGLPSFPVPRRAQRLLVFSFDYSACGQPIASSDLAAYCSASSARAEFLQRVRRLLTGGSLRPACALGGNRLASLFQDEVLQQPLFFVSTKKEPVPQRGGSTSRSDVRERSEGNPSAGLSSGASAEEEAIFIACNKNGDKRRNRGLLQKQSFCNSLVVIPKILIQS